ncbi:cupredoxin domain-containing protein [Lysobacter humi (ex Lee et al. 2017)]
MSASTVPAARPAGRAALRRLRAAALALLLALVAIAGWAAFAPLPRPATREAAFVIPEGTWRRRMAGEPVEILPQRIELTLGLSDVLRLENRDTVPQTFGPALLMPGQTFRLPFEQAADYEFACSAHASGQMVVAVAPFPGTPWARLRWRLARFADAFDIPRQTPASTAVRGSHA